MSCGPVDGEQQRQRGHRLLPAGEVGHGLEALPGGHAVVVDTVQVRLLGVLGPQERLRRLVHRQRLQQRAVTSTSPTTVTTATKYASLPGRLDKNSVRRHFNYKQHFIKYITTIMFIIPQSSTAGHSLSTLRTVHPSLTSPRRSLHYMVGPTACSTQEPVCDGRRVAGGGGRGCTL